MITICGRTCRVRLGRMGRVRCEPGWELGPDWASRLADFDLWYVWAGRGAMKLKSGEIVKLAPGVGVWMRPGRHYETAQAANDRLGVNYIHFDLLRPRRNLPLSGFVPPFEVFHCREVEFTDAVMRRVCDLEAGRFADAAAAASARKSATGLFEALLMELDRDRTARGPLRSVTPTPREGSVARAIARIREDPGRAPGVAELARSAGFSPDHFSRIFKQATGQPPEAFVIQTKMDRARRLLEETALPVHEIAETLGFQDIYFFSRQFKQKTGWTPTAWRRRPSC